MTESLAVWLMLAASYVYPMKVRLFSFFYRPIPGVGRGCRFQLLRVSELPRVELFVCWLLSDSSGLLAV